MGNCLTIQQGPRAFYLKFGITELAVKILNLTSSKFSTNLSHKIFSFCEQTLKMGANDASGQGLQSALKNKVF